MRYPLVPALLICSSLLAAEPGFTDILPGADLAGWRGADTFDHRRLMAMPAPERTAKIDAWNKAARAHWRVEGAELLTTGHGPCIATLKDYADVEFRLEYMISPNGDSGVYLRNVPQVQIWDPENKAEWKHGANKGSGGLWNNSPGAPGKDPLVKADKPAGQWNALRIVQVGARVSVWLNDQRVVDHAILENYYDRSVSIPAAGPLLLQSHGNPTRWRNLRVREIPSEEANRILRSQGREGYGSVFTGKDLVGWKGDTRGYVIQDGAIVCNKGGNLFLDRELADFAIRLEFRLPKGGNNGLAIRSPGKGNSAYEGMCECQVLDDNYELSTGQKIDPRQVHGSAYGMVAAQRGYQRPIGEWNFQEVTVVGHVLKVELNGTVILNADLSKVDMSKVMANSPHPGKDRLTGLFGFLGHGDPVAFRAIELREIKPAK
ncbi:MAG: 3-keto-disaccharide hydrolase [Opitutales bacterium]